MEQEKELSGWWTISSADFMKALELVEGGQPAEMVYMEWYANSDVSKPQD